MNLHQDNTIQIFPFDIALSLLEKYWFHSIIIFFGYQILFNKTLSIEVQMIPKYTENNNVNKNLDSKSMYNKTNIYTQGISIDKKIPDNKVSEVKKLVNNIKSSPQVSKHTNVNFVQVIANGKIHLSQYHQQKLQAIKYIERFVKVAQSEMKKFGIPASISLAQAIIASNAGNNKLAKEFNNHFALTCKDRCNLCHCRNYREGRVYDLMQTFETAWLGYRNHSHYLTQNIEYKPLFLLDIQDYKAWAQGLQKSHYSDDSQYASNLIKIIESLDLYKFDQVSI